MFFLPYLYQKSEIGIFAKYNFFFFFNNKIYQLNHINSYHNGLKKLVKSFAGVFSIKYLNNHMMWNSLL